MSITGAKIQCALSQNGQPTAWTGCTALQQSDNTYTVLYTAPENEGLYQLAVTVNDVPFGCKTIVGVLSTNDCSSNPEKYLAGVFGCSESDDDCDGDGVPDCIDICVDDLLKNDPGVCGCGSPDIDTDSDGLLDCQDGCPTDPAKDAPGACGCGTSDFDSDGDGVADCNDGCLDDF